MPHPHSHGHGHPHPAEGGHGHAPSASYNRAFVVGLLLNGGFVLVEASFGVIAGSVALLADAGHNLSDVLGLLLAWVASLLTARQPSPQFTYGWRKSSVLAAFLNAIFLMMEYAEAGRSSPMVRVVVGNQRMGLL